MIEKIFLFITLTAITISSQTMHDLIQPVNLNQDGVTGIVLSDLFYSESYNIELNSNENIKTWLNAAGDTIYFLPENNFTGLDLVSFKLGSESYVIPVKLNKTKKYLFTYEPERGNKQVNLFGQFNSWNRQNLPMKDLNGDRILEIEIPLDPGRYEYKFYVDGKELIDPENPVKVPNGLGDFNSVRIIEEEAIDKMFLHILGKKETENELILKFYFENVDRSNEVRPESVIALFDNQKFPSGQMVINGREINLALPKEMLKGSQSVRIAVNRMGKHSNIQIVQLHDGIVAGSSGKRTGQGHPLPSSVFPGRDQRQFHETGRN